MHVATSPSRGPNTTERHRTIVVGYDGSSEAQAALAAAARAGKGGTVVAVYAAEPTSKWLDTPHYARVSRCNASAQRGSSTSFEASSPPT